jgi:hypothetical protein
VALANAGVLEHSDASLAAALRPAATHNTAGELGSAAAVEP